MLASPWLHPEGGGLERYAATIARELSRLGHEVALLGHARVPVDEIRDGVRTIGVRPRRIVSNTPLSWEIGRVARTLLPADIVNVHTPVPGTAELVARVARRAGVPYVVTYHAGMLGAPPGVLSLAASTYARTLERAMLQRASERIAVSPFVAERVFRELRAHVVPPGVDLARFASNAPAVPGRILFVGTVSRAYAWKGFEVLVDAFERLARRDPQAHLRIVGGGDLVESYRARLAGLPATFAGRVDDASLAREYARASVVVLPSTTDAESFGMCLAEANASGRPVVASRIGGIPSFVAHEENGLLVPPGDAAALADALGRVLSDASLAKKLGEAGRAKVAAAHDWPTLARRTEALFVTAVTSGAARSD